MQTQNLFGNNNASNQTSHGGFVAHARLSLQRNGYRASEVSGMSDRDAVHSFERLTVAYADAFISCQPTGA